MPTARAHVETEHASRYLAQVCRHLDHMIGPGRQEQAVDRHLRASNKAQAHSEIRAHVEWSDTDGTVAFDWGRCTLRADPDALTLRAEGNDDASLRRVQDLVTDHLERFGERDHLTVSWQPG